MHAGKQKWKQTLTSEWFKSDKHPAHQAPPWDYLYLQLTHLEKEAQS